MHNIEVVIDRLVIDEEIRARLADSVETACALSGGILLIDVVGGRGTALLAELRMSGARREY